MPALGKHGKPAPTGGPALGLLVVLGLGAAACIELEPPEVGPGDDAGAGNADQDEDGLCDAAEAIYGARAGAQDSDGDGLADGFEVLVGADPADAAVPGAENTITLSDAERTAVLELGAEVTGAGETYAAFLRALRAPFNGSRSAEELLGSVRALSAVPAGNVATIEAEEARFLGVAGETELLVEAAFGAGDAELRDCVEQYAYQFGVKGPGGAVVPGSARLVVLRVVREDVDAASATHCAPVIACLSAL